jgi:hypothetical protein
MARQLTFTRPRVVCLWVLKLGRHPRDTLIRATLPDYQEIERVPYAVPQDQQPDGMETRIVISADHKTLAYAFGHTIVCRRTQDSALLWTQRIEREFFGTRTLTVSADIHLLMESYDIASRHLVATGTHDRVPPGRFQILNGVFDNADGIQFTSDGK